MKEAQPYYALGMAKGPGKPIVLLCTSGTAAYNYAPAVAEAHFSRVPLIVLTADRPQDSAGHQDNQAIYQEHIYGAHAEFLQLTPQEATSEETVAIFTNAWMSAYMNDKSVLHINIAIEEPFYPDKEERFSYRALSTELFKHQAQPAHLPALSRERTLFVVGGMQELGEERARLSQLLEGAPLVADVLSGCKGFNYNTHDLDTALELFEATRYVKLGDEIVDKRTRRVLSKHMRGKSVLHFQEQKEPIRTFKTESEWLTGYNQKEQLAVLLQLLDAQDADAASRWHSVSSKVKEVSPSPQLPAQELAAFSTIVQALDADGVLHLGNSSPVRYADIRRENLPTKQIYANRGTSGIDGCVSTALGIARVQPERQHLLIVGDLSFIYDSNALWQPELPTNIKIVVFNNKGGGIFRGIQSSANQPELERYFEAAPSGMQNLKGFGAAYHIYYSCLEKGEHLLSQMEEELRMNRIALLELVL